MTRKKASGQPIPNQATNSVLRRDLGTSATTNEEGPKVGSGTTSFGINGLNYEPIPPRVKEPHAQIEPYWTFDRILAALGGIGLLIAVVLFFNHMDSNISDVKADVREGNDKMGKLEEKSNKQTAAIEIVTGSVQRLENEVLRTQDYIQEKKK